MSSVGGNTTDVGTVTTPYKPMICRKCGSSDIATQWHRTSYDCRITQQGESGAESEHLHKTCRLCGFYWRTPTNDAESQR